jgi:glutamate--cysteine ligase
VSLRRSVEALFAPARHPGRVGAELELIAVTDERRPRPVHPATLASLIEPGLPVCFEPGGQLELSLPPEPGPSELVASAEHAIGRVSDIAAAQGIRLESTGTNAYHSCSDVPLFIATPRYQQSNDCLTGMAWMAAG